MTDNYSRETIRLLLERHPEYLSQILHSILGRHVQLSTETSKSISVMIAHHKQMQIAVHESSISRCRCGSKLVVTREVQTRSTDESSTIVHICTSCGLKY
jgi:DNA-directed RNA polymerase subunit M/transcription elongation factor TFIIS